MGVTKGIWAGLVLALPGAWTLSGATPITARLLGRVSTYYSKTGDPVEALIVPPACAEPNSVLPAGTILAGHIAKIHKVGLGLIHETASLRLVFDELRMPDGRRLPVQAKLVSVEDSRERVDKKGGIHGIRATASLSSRLAWHIGWEITEHPALVAPALLVEATLFSFPDPEIEYGRGTELNFRVDLPDLLPRPTACPAPAAEESADLRAMVQALPFWSFSKRQPQPMDLVNLVFVGSGSELELAFTAAGWTGSVPNSMATGFNAVRAIAEEHGYADAPMRTLLLDGNQPAISLQQSANTFTKRDHLRIWKRSEVLNGETVWASSATRDIGATFSTGHPFGFTHQIEGDVDRERDKVVNDLWLTGCADSVQYVDRGQPPRDAAHPYRRGIHTDGRVAVVFLNSCEAPAEDFANIGPDPEPGQVVQIFRRLSLTARNHFMRDNVFYRSADMARMGVMAVRRLYLNHRDEHRAELQDAQRAKAAAPATPENQPSTVASALPHDRVE